MLMPVFEKHGIKAQRMGINAKKDIWLPQFNEKHYLCTQLGRND